MNSEPIVETPSELEPQPPIFKDQQGRFMQGNKGGPGNPFGRQVALLRSIVLQASTEERMEELIEMLWKLALDGNLAAVRLILQYTLGKPGRAVEPDRVEIDDWNLKKENAVLPAEMLATPLKVTAERSNRVCEMMWPTLEVETLRPFKESLREKMKESEQKPAAKNEARAGAAAVPEEAKRGKAERSAPRPESGPPSPNGFFGATLDESSWLDLIRPYLQAPSVVNAPAVER